MKQILTVAAACLLVASCDLVKPEQVCASDDTLTAVRDIMLEILGGNESGLDQQLMRRAFVEAVTIDLITFEGKDPENSTIRCKARASVAGASAVPFTYTRQPDVGADGYVYYVEISKQHSWLGISRATAEKYRDLHAAADQARGPGASAPAMPPADPTPSAQSAASVVSQLPTSGGAHGTCDVRLDGGVAMSGRCSGAYHETSVVLGNGVDGCHVELRRQGGATRALVYGYRNICMRPGTEEPIDDDIDLGPVRPQGNCWRNDAVSVCLD